MRWLTLLLGLVLVAPASAQTEGAPADFSAYEQAMASGKRTDAADALLAIIDDPGASSSHAEAWGRLGGLLVDYDLKTAALHAYASAVQADAKAASPHVNAALDTAEAIGDTGRLGAVFATHLGADVDSETRSRMAYYAARELLRQDELGAALGIATLVDSGSEIFPDAESLRGVVLSMQGRHEDALAPMLTAQALARDLDRGVAFDSVISLNVARTYYGAKNWTKAVYWFEQVSRDSDYWPEAQYERAWAHFRADDMQGAVAALHSHDAPFFDAWYFPEADLLRAYSYFMMCKFGDASKEMDEFTERYTPLKAELDTHLGTLTPEDGWAEGLAMQSGSPTTLPAMLLRSFRAEQRLADSALAVRTADQELTRVGALDGTQVGPRARQWTEDRKNEITRAEGERILRRAQLAQAELEELLTGMEITRLDLLNLETEMYQRASVTGKLDYGDPIGKLREMKKKRRGMRVWPYQGEFWADELGWYVVDARPECPESMNRGESDSSR